MKDYIQLIIELLIYAAGVAVLAMGLITIICWMLSLIIKAIRRVIAAARQ